MDGSNGDKVAAVLRPLLLKLGRVNQVVCDQGSDLLRGVRILDKDHPGISLTYDVRHLCAALLRGWLRDCPRWREFVRSGRPSIMPAIRASQLRREVGLIRYAPPELVLKPLQPLGGIKRWFDRLQPALLASHEFPLRRTGSPPVRTVGSRRKMHIDHGNSATGLDGDQHLRKARVGWGDQWIL